jgi:hypothetical protein
MKKFSTLLNTFILFTFLTIGITVWPLTVKSQTQIFLSVIDDLPLMPGLSEDADGALSFDMANGRIAEITAAGTVEVGDVIDYYARTLPQLGWKLETSDRYLREEEVLNIDVAKSNEDSVQVIVHFRLSPVGTK